MQNPQCLLCHVLWLAIDKKEKWLGDIKDLSEPSQNIGLSFDSFFCNCLKRMKWERLMLITLNQNTKEIAPYFTFSIKTKIHYLAPNENIKNMQIQNGYACITIGHKDLPFFRYKELSLSTSAVSNENLGVPSHQPCLKTWNKLPQYVHVHSNLLKAWSSIYHLQDVEFRIFLGFADKANEVTHS